MPTVKHPKNPNTDTAFVTDDNGHTTRAVKTVLLDGTVDYPKNSNSDSCYVTVDGKKQRALMTADISSEGSLSYPNNSNSTKGYVTVNGKKQRVILTASLVGGGSTPVIEELNVTPSTSAQTITAPSGTDGYSPVNVSAVTSSIDANIQAGNIKDGVTILGVQGTYTGGGGSNKRYQLLDRVVDDNNTDIGCVVGFHYDANNTEYAIVCLNAQYRNSSGQYLSERVEVTGLALLNDQTILENTDTATSNCTKILDFINSSIMGYTSSAVTHCRSLSFVIEGTTYYGQLPTIVELTDVFRHRTAINNADTSASQYSSLIVPSSTNTWSSTQGLAASARYIASSGNVVSGNKNSSCFVLPILEIPNTISNAFTYG